MTRLLNYKLQGKKYVSGPTKRWVVQGRLQWSSTRPLDIILETDNDDIYT